MNYCNLVILFLTGLFFLRTFGHRFERYTTTNATSTFNDNGKIGEGVHLASDDIDEADTVTDGENVTLIGPGTAQLQLKNYQLKFEFCTQNCWGQTITVCYDAANPNPFLQGRCKTNQCEFQVTIKTDDGDKLIRFDGRRTYFTRDKCHWAIMQFPNADVSFTTELLESCEPLLNDENVINLSVTGATSECFLKALQATKWIPTTTPQPSTSTSESPTIPSKLSKEKEEDTLTALMPLWIVLGIFLFILVAAVIIIGILCWRKHKRSSGAAKVSPSNIQIHPGSKTEANAVEEGVTNERETRESVEQPMKKTTKTEEKSQPSKSDLFPDVVPQKVSTEPTVQDQTTNLPQEQKQIGPVVVVPAKPIQPRSKSDSRSRVRDSVSVQHDSAMKLLIESQPEALKHHCSDYFKTSTNLPVIQRIENFYPAEIVARPLQNREIEPFCAKSIDLMFQKVENLIDDAQSALAVEGVKYDSDGNISLMTERAEKYLAQPSTPEFVRSYVFGSIFLELLDSNIGIQETFSIPLLFVIVLQRRYPVMNRRKACAFIRRQMPIIFAEFSLKELQKLAYPISAIEAAYKMDPEGFKNVSCLDTVAENIEEDETQASVTEKRPKKDGGKKKQHRTKK